MHRRMNALALLGLALTFVSSAAPAQYKLTNLDSNQVGKANHPADPLLVNAWGLARGATSPWWVSDNGSGWSTLYNGGGVKQGLEVLIPSAGQGPGTPTGIVFNGSSDFQVQGWNSFFIFATLDGTISAWAPQANFNDAVIMVPSSGAVYTGLAVTANASGNVLFAADNANNKVDMYDGSFHLVNSFTDPTVPTGFAPFGIQDINGLVFVTFASPAGGTGGFIDIYSEKGEFLKRLAQGPPLNQPWGLAAAPKNFGPLSNTLLVTNNLNIGGVINGFNALTGQWVGTMKDTTGVNLRIDQVWGVGFGGGTAANGGTNELFFTAGPNNNKAGTFGSIRFVP